MTRLGRLTAAAVLGALWFRAEVHRRRIEVTLDHITHELGQHLTAHAAAEARKARKRLH